ncbi:MAG: virulence RhuM family protein [Ignavibacteriaceae bacterium]|nr:virulence RhuM family protein [Ignavibacteriaceae bacterium]
MQTFEVLLYSTPENKTKIEVFFEGDTFWLSQKKISELFNVDVRTVSEHLLNIFKTSELDENSVIRKFRITADDGKNYLTQFYNLDAIIAVGYRVNSKEATAFRIWATNTLREFIVKGFVLDDERLKQGAKFGKDYFEELLERIREIRASERRFYQKITDIYSQCSIDYDPNSEITKQFYKTVQNKLHWAITGKTAAELIAGRADAAKPNMGLTTWKESPAGKIMKFDVGIAKNYLNKEELEALNRIVVMYLDYAENQAKRNIQMTMKDWTEKLDGFLNFNDYNVLKDAGKITHEIAVSLAEKEYGKYHTIQDHNYESDFDKEIKKLQDKISKKKARNN